MPIELRNTDDQPEETKQLLNNTLNQFNEVNFETTLSVLMTATAEVLAQMNPVHQLSAVRGLKQFADVMGVRSLENLVARSAGGEEDDSVDGHG